MTDDRNNDGSGAGFDDWLDDDPGPVTDPYKVLASEEPDEEIVDAETAEIDAVVVDESPVDSISHETAELDAVILDEPVDTDSVGGEETAEIDAIVEIEPDGDDLHEDTGELEILAVPEDEPPSSDPDNDSTDELEIIVEDSDGATEDAEPPSDDDDLPPVALVGFGELWDDESDGDVDATSSETSADFFDITQDNYLHTATKDHEGLAASMALAENEDTEQAALAAPIPGLDPTVVGFEDVVEAEGLGRVRARASGDLVARVITAVVLIAALGASLYWQPALVALAITVFVLGAGEFYTALVRSGRKPIALFGFIGIIGASLGAFFSGALWIPLAFILAVTLLLLFYAVVPGKIDPMANLALTITVMVWAGLGAYAMLIIKSDSYRTLVFGVVAAVAAMDIAQYFFGRALGRHKLSPWVSPNKTIEGLIAGVIVALVVGALLHFLKPFELTSGLAIGAAVAVLAPMGDLAMSAAKRSLDLKDMGSVLPGHGGFMDRIDGLLFVIPVAWAIFFWAGIL
jgi:phosphatidate cytidylyltransferase